MEIILGKTAGFCYGVKRAVESSKKDIEQNKKICALGELVHNKQVIEDLENKGLRFIEDIEEIKDEDTMIIRAHGISKKIYEFAEQKNIKIKDYTCPFVLKIHEIVDEYSKKGYYILLSGNKNHPENIGTISYAGDNYDVIDENNLEMIIRKIKELNIKKILLISQTTYSLEKFNKIQKRLEELRNNTRETELELVINNTICKATELRQKETEEISKKVGYMIIIGGKNSSNTKKLYDISIINCKNTILIETKDDIDKEIKEKIMESKSVGVMAGASTPKESIDDVIDYLNK